MGNVATRADNDGSTTTYGYDNANQLTSDVRTGTGGNNYSISYTYDGNGNRATKVLGGVTDTYSYDSHDKLTAISRGGSNIKTYAYDNNGNCTSVTVVSGSLVTSLSYDYENRLTGITYPSTATNSFQYNGLGLRMQKVDSSGTVNYICDGTNPASAVLADSNATYTPGLSERRSGTSKFLHSDALGTTRGITNSSQAATDGLLCDAFGMSVSRTGTTPTPFGFVGGAQYQTDTDSGLMLLGHRYYDSSIGRFITQDPIGDGDNWYSYSDNNPMIETDPEGLQAKGDKSVEEYDKHIRDIDDHKRKLIDEKNKLRNTRGDKARKAVEIEIDELERGIKGHEKEVGQKWPNGRPQVDPVIVRPTQPQPQPWYRRIDWGDVAIGVGAVIVIGVGIAVAPELTIPAVILKVAH
jgi:RHS repeat-associated protein